MWNYIWSSSGGNGREVSDAVCFCFAFCFVCLSQEKKKWRNLDARHVSALLKAEHLGCHSWHSCKALKAAKAKTTISRQAADLQIWQLLSVIGGWHSTHSEETLAFLATTERLRGTKLNRGGSQTSGGGWRTTPAKMSRKTPKQMIIYREINVDVCVWPKTGLFLLFPATQRKRQSNRSGRPLQFMRSQEEPGTHKYTNTQMTSHFSGA